MGREFWSQSEACEAIELARHELLILISDLCLNYHFKAFQWRHETKEFAFYDYKGVPWIYTNTFSTQLGFAGVYNGCNSYYHSQDLQIYMDFLSGREIFDRINAEKALGHAFFYFEQREIDFSITPVQEILNLLGIRSWFYFSPELKQTFFFVLTEDTEPIRGVEFYI